MTGFYKQALCEIIGRTPGLEALANGLPDTRVTGIHYDSRQVVPGSIFVALTGGSLDGHQYIPQAVQRGAIAVVGSREMHLEGTPYLRVADTRRALAWLSSAFYNFPGRQLTVIGVTGTDGKTTTSNLIYEILLAAGINAGIISTVNAVIGDDVVDTGFHVTTPEAPDVQRYLARMVNSGLTHVVLETTSHGLAQERVTGCEYDVAVVTNITHEHLDYHGTYEAYRESKARLFHSLRDTSVKQNGNIRLAVLNRDDASYDFLSSLELPERLDYGISPTARIRAENIRYDGAGGHFDVIGPDSVTPVKTSLMGLFNVSNCLAAIATAMGLGIPMETAAAGIARLRGVAGRMEQIHLGQDFIALVDFAHTPNALASALRACREMTPGRVIAVFGSAGLRDREKRRMMAEVSAELADVTVLTAEDPRTESLDAILAEMRAGAEARGGVLDRSVFVRPDRGEAIRFAVRMARPGDLVVACGKGHEQSMCFGVTEFPWDDRTAMRAALSEHLGLPVVKMPYLPTQGPQND